MIVTPSELSRRAELYHQLGAMISAGIPLIRALEMAASNPVTRRSQGVILQLIEKLKVGITFSDSMVSIHGWMPDFDVALLSVGEKSGRLDNSFEQLSVYYDQRARIIRDTIAGLLMTAVTLHVFLVIFPLRLWTSFFMGVFYGNFEQCVPFLIQKVVVFGGGYLAIFGLIYACQGNRGEPWRAIVERLLDLIPMLRGARRNLILSRLAASLEALISAGVSIVEAWELAAAASGSPQLKWEIAKWRPAMNAGTTPAELVTQTRYFPEMFANLYHSGEVSGRQDEMLGRLRNYYEEEGFRRLRLFSRIMNGTIYGFIVLIVAYNVITFHLGRISSALEAF